MEMVASEIKVDFSGLERELTARLGVKDLQIMGRITKARDGGDRIEFESNELKNQTGIMYSIYKTFKITDFSSGWLEEEKKFYVGVDFAYQFKDGGSNGAQIFVAFYTPETNTWEFKDR